jgi:hypothetical protein
MMKLLSNFAIKFNLRRYIVVFYDDIPWDSHQRGMQAGAYTRPLLGST